MPPAPGLDELVSHLERSTRLTRTEVAKVLDEMTAYFSESVDEFVARRHAELQSEALKNEAIFERIADELRTRRFAAPSLSARQIRRIIYG